MVKPRNNHINKTGHEKVRIPEESGDVMVKRIANKGVHDVEKQYRKLPRWLRHVIVGSGCGGGGAGDSSERNKHFVFHGGRRALAYCETRKTGESPNQRLRSH